MLKDDWDSYGGKSPTVTAVLVAGRPAQGAHDRYGPIFGEAVLPTSISPLAYGGVELEWEGRGVLLALDIGPDGNVGAMIRRGTGTQAGYEERDHLDWDDALDRIGETKVAP